jgi:hypothetical protein
LLLCAFAAINNCRSAFYKEQIWVSRFCSSLFYSAQTDIDPKLGTPNTDIGRVYQGSHPTPSNLPPHRYVMATEKGTPWIVNNNADGDLRHGWITLKTSQASGGIDACPSVRYLPGDGYYYTISGGHIIHLRRSKDLKVWETAKDAFIQASANDTLIASSIMTSAAENIRKSHANLSIPVREKWDKDANDGDICCESWGGASPEKGGPSGSFIVWGADGQGGSGFTAGPEGVAAIATSNMPLDKLLQSYFP